ALSDLQICSAASIPLRTGMHMSTMRTSGFNLAAALSRDWPSFTAPTTSNAGSRKLAASSKKFALPSARSIRVWLKLLHLYERGNQQTRSMTEHIQPEYCQ